MAVKSMIKAILFDFDGVLTIDKTGSTSIINYIAKECDLPIDTVKACYYKHNKLLLNGETTHKQIWPEFCNDIGKPIDFQVLIDSFTHTVLDMNMIHLVKELKSNYLIGMVKYNNPDRIKTILDYNHMQNDFDVVAVSAEQHSGKSDYKIFQYVLDTLKVTAQECVFIDNTEKNLVVPNEMGMGTIMFDDETRDFAQFKARLESFF